MSFSIVGPILIYCFRAQSTSWAEGGCGANGATKMHGRSHMENFITLHDNLALKSLEIITKESLLSPNLSPSRFI
jgi:hypothetical protein